MPDPLTSRLRARLDPAGSEPMSRQLVEALWMEVVEGRIPTGERLPTVRQLAIALGLSPRSVQRAYRELGRLGVTATRPGEGTFVSLDPPPEHERQRRQSFAILCRETVESARELGFDVNDLLDEIREFRRAGQDEMSAGPPHDSPDHEEHS